MVFSGFWRRLTARIIDLIIFMPLIFINDYLLKHTYPIIYQINNYLISLIILTYNILLIYFKGATIGKMILSIRVVQTDSSKVNFLNAFLRELLSLLSLPLTFTVNITTGDTKDRITFIHNIFLLIFIIEHFIFFTNPNRKTLHDYIAGTVVVLCKR